MTASAIKQISEKREQLEEVLKSPHCDEIDNIFESFRSAGFNKEDTLTFMAQLNYLLYKDVYIKLV